MDDGCRGRSAVAQHDLPARAALRGLSVPNTAGKRTCQQHHDCLYEGAEEETVIEVPEPPSMRLQVALEPIDE